MDQDAFRQTYREVNERFCAYEKAVLTNKCGCSQSEKFCIAEREGVHCNSDSGQQRCLDFLAILRDQARFALRNVQQQQYSRLPHGKAIRVQVGGMRGLFHVLHPGKELPECIPDIDRLLQEAEETWGELDAVPFSDIMPEISGYEIKRRSRRHRDRKDS
ncbi:MAG: hypothetical protein PVJ14_08340 [Chromatiales bacterium]|jgi:hypothetical protein